MTTPEAQVIVVANSKEQAEIIDATHDRWRCTLGRAAVRAEVS